MKVSRAFTNILSNDIEATATFFKNCLKYEVAFVSDWFIHLTSKDNPSLEIGVLRIDHEIVPNQIRGSFASAFLTFVVDDVDMLFKNICQSNYEILEEPKNLFYGQRRIVVRERESGVVCDFSSECAPSKEFLDSLK